MKELLERRAPGARNPLFRLLLFVFAVFALQAAPAKAEPRTLELRIPCRVGSEVQALLPDGSTVLLGKVVRVPVKTNWPAYTASRWARPSAVCASAVNAVHLLVDVEKDRGRILSLVPAVTVAPAAASGAFFALSMPAGTGVFGGFAPVTGSPVTLERNGESRPLSGVPQEDDTLVIRTVLPGRPPVWKVDIENRPGGRVIAWGRGPSVIARVLHPVTGVGRFGGTQFQGRGRIRASHCGVIDVATAPRGQVGGFQIMPLIHALGSREMESAWAMTQWMVLGPLPGEPSLAGRAPLFSGSLLPGTQLQDRLPDLWSQFGRKPLVLCRRNGGPWEALPCRAERQDHALSDVTHLRLFFPFWDEPQPEGRP